jgi:hypothetical protein
MGYRVVPTMYACGARALWIGSRALARATLACSSAKNVPASEIKTERVDSARTEQTIFAARTHSAANKKARSAEEPLTC